MKKQSFPWPKILGKEISSKIKWWKTGLNRVFRDKEDKLPVVCVFGIENLELITPVKEDYEESRLDVRCYPPKANLEKILVKDRPHVLITIGQHCLLPQFKKVSSEIKRRWLHYETMPSLEQVSEEAYKCYLKNVFNDQQAEKDPLVSVFTAAYKTGEKIYRPFRSLREQTYTNWEWIVVDDSDDGGRTFKVLIDLAKKDYRVQVFKPWEHSGVIGRLKKWAASLGRGQILVELDHDDEFTDYALDYVVKGFNQYPEAGFLYTNCAEVYEDGRNLTYRDGWAFGYGSYSDVEYRGKVYKCGNAPHINAKTIRHIISAPNHLRAWRKSFYESIGGHNQELHVADDYEILVRTFLNTRMVHIPKLCYIQYVSHSAQLIRNRDIHRHVRSIREYYDKKIHERFLELGCFDFAWDEEKGCSDLSIPNPQVEPHVTLIADV